MPLLISNRIHKEKGNTAAFGPSNECFLSEVHGWMSTEWINDSCALPLVEKSFLMLLPPSNPRISNFFLFESEAKKRNMV